MKNAFGEEDMTCPHCAERKGRGRCFLTVDQRGNVDAWHESGSGDSYGTCEYWQQFFGANMNDGKS